MSVPAKSSLLRAVTLVGIFTIGYKTLSALQQIVLARVFGVSSATDAFFLAQILPVLLGGLLFASTSTALVTNLRSPGARIGARELSGILLSVTLFFGLVAASVAVFSHPIAVLLGSGSDPQVVAEVRRLLVLMSPMLLFLPMSGVLSGIHLSALRYSLSPASLCLIYVFGVGSLALAAHFGIEAFAVGIVFGSLMQTILLWLMMPARTLDATPRLDRPGLSAFARQAMLVFGSAAVSTLFLVIDRWFGASGTGYATAITYAGSLITIPSQIVVSTLTGTFLPTLTSAHSDCSEFTEAFKNLLVWLLFPVLPMCAAIAVAGTPVVRLFLQGGHFTHESLMLTGRLLTAYAAVALGLVLKDAITMALIACGQAPMATWLGLGAVLLSAALKWWLVPRYDILIIPRTTAIATWVAVVALTFILASHFENGWASRFWSATSGLWYSGAITCAIGASASVVVRTWPHGDLFLLSAISLVYIAACLAFRVEPLGLLFRRASILN